MPNLDYYNTARMHQMVNSFQDTFGVSGPLPRGESRNSIVLTFIRDIGESRIPRVSIESPLLRRLRSEVSK